MKVLYNKLGSWQMMPQLLVGEKDMLSLSNNTWNDYGYNTTLNAVLYRDGKEFFSFQLKILIDGIANSIDVLNQLIDDGWDGSFPLPGLKYITVPSDINFYDALNSFHDDESIKNLLGSIKDAAFFRLNESDYVDDLISRNNECFNLSILRESGARKAYEDGWKLFRNIRFGIEDFYLNIIDHDDNFLSVDFRFNSEFFPYDINVLIGENGVGKSYTLKSFVEYYLMVGKGSPKYLIETGLKPFSKYPNISNLILISYSPFEEYIIDLSESSLKNKDAYKYFGFRYLDSKSESISRTLPYSDSIRSIIQSLRDDNLFGMFDNWEGKFSNISSILRSVIGFESILVELFDGFEGDEFVVDFGGKKYLEIGSDSYGKYFSNGDDFLNKINLDSGIYFSREGRFIDISSGQRFFCYMVINIIGHIRKDSLVIIDEPELFLHPALEIMFISLLKKVLSVFNSKAILATHSLSIVREIPSKCVHVYRKNTDGLSICNPPFETFGGNIQKISSYVFGDSYLTKPFDTWLDMMFEKYKDPLKIIDVVGDDLNTEMLIRIKNYGNDYGFKN